jgi:hypothetical protein
MLPNYILEGITFLLKEQYIILNFCSLPTEMPLRDESAMCFDSEQ